MPVEECVRQIVEATRARKRELVMTLQGKIGLWLKLAFPKIVDRMVLRAVRSHGVGLIAVQINEKASQRFRREYMSRIPSRQSIKPRL